MYLFASGYVCIYMYVSVCFLCVNVRVCIYIYTFTHTHTHIYIYIYIYMCVCVCVCVCAQYFLLVYGDTDGFMVTFTAYISREARNVSFFCLSHIFIFLLM